MFGSIFVPGARIYSPMPHAKLTVTVPERVWIGEISRRYPDAVFRVLAAFTDDDAGIGLAEIESDRLAAILRDMDDSEDVGGLEILRHTESKALVQFETTMPLLLLPARDSGVPLEMPVEICDGTVTWDLTAPRDRLSALADQLENFDISYRVEYVREEPSDETLLTDRQRRIVTAALEAGYYDTPRETSLTDLADELDIAKSTASETLHRAEEKIIKDFLELSEAAAPPAE
jgi:hypothetical protein